MATARSERNTIAYELARPERWQELLGAASVVSTEWLNVFNLAAVASQLNIASEKGESVRRVAATKAAKQIDALAAVLGVSPLPPTAGRSDAWEVVTAWLELETRALADGTSSAFRRTAVAREIISSERSKSARAKSRASTKEQR